MRIPRVYLPDPLATGHTVIVSEKRLHYLSHVLRLTKQAPLIIFNGEGGEFDATLSSVTKRQAEIMLGQFRNTDRESPLRITLAQGLAKGEKMDWIVQKATELGVSEILPLFTRYSDVKLNEERSEKRTSHWQDVAISACEQCGRTRLPLVHPPQALDMWISSLGQPQSGEQRLILNPAQDSATLPASIQHAVLLVGPEGGFREDEITQAHMSGFLNWNLGPRILRAETAAVSTVSLAQARWGDLS